MLQEAVAQVKIPLGLFKGDTVSWIGISQQTSSCSVTCLHEIEHLNHRGELLLCKNIAIPLPAHLEDELSDRKGMRSSSPRNEAQSDAIRTAKSASKLV